MDFSQYIIWIVIAATAIVSFKGFQDSVFFQRNLFEVQAIQKRQFFRLFTAGFLHADVPHLVFNMITLYFFAPLVVMVFGVFGFLQIYIAAIIGGNYLSSYIYRHRPQYSAVGASGGVSGVLFAAIAINPHIGIGMMFIPIDIPGYIFGFLYFGYSVYLMIKPQQWDNTGHAAHLGGAVIGLLAVVLMYFDFCRENAGYLFVLSLPLLYLAYEIFYKKRVL